MKPKILILIMLLIAGFQQKVDAQNVALKTNGLYWLRHHAQPWNRSSPVA